MKNCVIFAAGIYGTEKINIPENSLIIAADAGYIAAQKYKIKPDIIIGDFDSSDSVPNGESVIVLPVEKDDTDTYAAAEYGIKNGCSSFYIYGGMGGRPDHTFANYSLLSYLCNKGFRAVMYGEGYSVTIIKNSSITISGKIKKKLSVFAYGENASGVYLKGLKYPLNNACVTCDYAIGVSNEFSEETAEVTVKNGCLLIMTEL